MRVSLPFYFLFGNDFVVRISCEQNVFHGREIVRNVYNVARHIRALVVEIAYGLSGGLCLICNELRFACGESLFGLAAYVKYFCHTQVEAEDYYCK